MSLNERDFAADDGGDALVEASVLERAGSLLVACLTEMKHNGAVEKCVQGLTALTERSATLSLNKTQAGVVLCQAPKCTPPQLSSFFQT